MGSFLEFTADGSCKQYTLISMNTNGWALTTWTEEYGTAAFDPGQGTVTLTVTKGKYKVTDNRVARNNYNRPMTDEEVRKAATTRTYKFARDEKGQPRFELGHRDGKGSTAYQPWDRD